MVKPRNTFIPVTRGLIHAYLLNGNATDSIGSNDGTVDGASLTTGRYGDSNTAYNFAGAETITIPDGTLSSTGTLSLWFNNETTDYSDQTDGVGYIFGSTPAGENRLYILLSNTSGTLKVRTGTTIDQSIFVPDLQTWYHLAVVYGGGNADVYINGSLVYSYTYTGLEGNPVTCSLGSYYVATKNYFKGKIDSVFIYNQKISADEIFRLYKGTGPLSVQQMKQLWLEDATGSTVSATKSLNDLEIEYYVSELGGSYSAADGITQLSNDYLATTSYETYQEWLTAIKNGVI